MRLFFVVSCVLGSALAYPHLNVEYDFFGSREPATQRQPCASCMENQRIFSQSRQDPAYINSPRFEYSTLVEKSEPVLLAPADIQPADASVERYRLPGVVRAETLEADFADPAVTRVGREPLPMPLMVKYEEQDGSVNGEKFALLREDVPRRPSRSPAETSSVPAQSPSDAAIDDFFLPMLMNLATSQQNADSIVRSARSTSLSDPAPARLARAAATTPEVVPILTNIPAQSINGDVVESILRSARSMQSSPPTPPQPQYSSSADASMVLPETTATKPGAAAPTEYSKDEQPLSVAGSAPKALGMYYIRVKAYNYPDGDILPAISRGPNDVAPAVISPPAGVAHDKTPCTKQPEQLDKTFYDQQDKEFVYFMQQLLVQQLSSLLEQQLVQQQDILKQFLSKQLEKELNTLTDDTKPAASSPSLVTPAPETFAATKVPETSPPVTQTTTAANNLV